MTGKEPFDRQYTFIADTDHSNLHILAQVPGIMRRFAAEGGKEMFLEQPKEVQELFEKYKAGKVSADKILKRQYSDIWTPAGQESTSGKLLLEIFNTAIDKGITLHCVDKQPVLPQRLTEAWNKIQPFLGLPEKQRKKAIEKLILDDRINHAQYGSMNDSNLQSDIDQIWKFIHDERDNDENLAKEIQKVGADGRKVLIYYGSRHDNEPKGVASYVGHKNMSTVLLVSDKNSDTAGGKVVTPTQGLNYYFYFIKEEQFLKLDNDCIDKGGAKCALTGSKEELIGRLGNIGGAVDVPPGGLGNFSAIPKIIQRPTPEYPGKKINGIRE